MFLSEINGVEMIIAETEPDAKTDERQIVGMRVELRPIRGAIVPPIVELRRLLKAMLRGWNFRCVSITPVFSGHAPEAEGGQHGNG
jgi:hypothetical protein